MRKIILTIVVVILFLAPHLYAITEWTHGDYTVGFEETYDVIKIYNDVTLSIYDGGEIGELWTHDITLTDMFGGTFDLTPYIVPLSFRVSSVN